MTHYVCEECEGVSQEEGMCQTEDCAKKGIALGTCSCEDEKHKAPEGGSDETPSETQSEESKESKESGE